MELVLPIIAYEHGDVTVFPSLRDAETYVEPIDIANGEYVFFDASGQILQAELHPVGEHPGSTRRRSVAPRQYVRIVVPSDADRQPDQLAAVLRDFLSRVGVDRTGIMDRQLATMSLDQLLEASSDLQ